MLSSTPSKFSRSTKFTTPATASAPYTVDAPPVSTSTRSINAVGIWLTSEAAELYAPPPPIRRPLIITSVLLAPIPRRSSVALPDAPLETYELSAASSWGRLLRKSSILLIPDALMSTEDATITGLELSKPSLLMRLPVTTTSSSASSWE